MSEPFKYYNKSIVVVVNINIACVSCCKLGLLSKGKEQLTSDFKIAVNIQSETCILPPRRTDDCFTDLYT